MKQLLVISCALLLATCCSPRMEAPKTVAPGDRAAFFAEEPSQKAPRPAPIPQAAPTPPHSTATAAVDKKVALTGKKGKKKSTIVDPIEPMDSLEVETDTKDWIVGKVGVVVVSISALEAGTTTPDGNVDIGVDAIPISEYYLVALEPALDGYFDILPVPGQQPKQHRASAGYAATWRYQVVPLKAGKVDLLFTLRVYQNDKDHSGTNISMRPWHLDVGTKTSSRVFLTSRWVSHNGGWGPIFAIIAAGLSALAASEWWRRSRKGSRSLKTPPTSSH